MQLPALLYIAVSLSRATLPAHCSTVYPCPERLVEAGGAPVAPETDGSHSSSVWGEAMGVPMVFQGRDLRFVAGRGVTTGWLLPPCTGCPNERATVPGG